jgi:hypothetical protein
MFMVAKQVHMAAVTLRNHREKPPLAARLGRQITNRIVTTISEAKAGRSSRSSGLEKTRRSVYFKTSDQAIGVRSVRPCASVTSPGAAVSRHR